MHCASCATNVQRSIGKVSGVKEVKANAITNTCFVETDEKVNEEDLKRAVTKLGYAVVHMEKQ